MTTGKLKQLSLGTALCAALAVMLTMTAASPARADDDRDWREHARVVHRYRVVHRRPVYTDVYTPPLVYAPPPPTYYGPPQPVYAEPAEPSLNFIIPLHFH